MLGGHIGDRACDLLDGRLDAAAELRARTHLGVCRSCAAAVHEQQAARAALRSAGVVTPPGELMAGLLSMPAAVRREPTRSAGRSRRTLVVSSLVVSTAAVASVGLFSMAGSAPVTAIADMLGGGRHTERAAMTLQPVVVAGGPNAGPHVTVQPVVFESAAAEPEP